MYTEFIPFDTTDVELKTESQKFLLVHKYRSEHHANLRGYIFILLFSQHGDTF